MKTIGNILISFLTLIFAVTCGWIVTLGFVISNGIATMDELGVFIFIFATVVVSAILCLIALVIVKKEFLKTDISMKAFIEISRDASTIISLFLTVWTSFMNISIKDKTDTDFIALVERITLLSLTMICFSLTLTIVYLIVYKIPSFKESNDTD